MMPDREVPPVIFKRTKKNIDQFLNVTKSPAALNCCVIPQPFTLKRSGRQVTTELQLSDFRADTEVRRGSKAASYNVKQKKHLKMWGKCVSQNRHFNISRTI